MKQFIKIMAATALLALVAWTVWFVGIVFEFEYPYTFTLLSVQHAKSIDGVPVSKIIRGDGANWPAHLDWYTDSYIDDSCGNVRGITTVALAAPDNSTRYYFAYSSETHTLVP